MAPGVLKRAAEGARVARRAALGVLGAGTAGLAAAPYLQRGLETLLGAANQADLTGLTGLLPSPGGFRCHSVVGSVPHNDATPEVTGRVRRFSTTRRMVHKSTGWLTLPCGTTAACFYTGPLSQLAGLASPVGHCPRMVGHRVVAALPAGAVLRRPPRGPAQVQPFRGVRPAVAERHPPARHGPRGPPGAGKFNAGHKIYAVSSADAVLVMPFTGLLLWFMGLLPFISRTSAIFLAIGVSLMTAAVYLPTASARPHHGPASDFRGVSPSRH
ncbi:hypothetical protein Srufu_004460 [Streptomyces libani subsp. rufus]|nr:hypothetical protein Srufu_004460 [Streptomyces libani subsp. rufus]